MIDPHIMAVREANLIPVHSGNGGFTCGVFDHAGLPVADTLHASSKERRVPEPAQVVPYSGAADFQEAIYGGVMFNHFGHFIMESIGRLWAVNHAAYRHLPIVVHMPWGPVDLETVDGFARTLLELFEIDPRRIHAVSRPMSAGTLHVPAQLYGFHCYEAPSAIFVDFLRVAQKNILEIARDFSTPSARVFVSRSHWQEKSPKRGIQAGALMFDDYLESEGWYVMQPESLSILDQLKIYATASTILVSEGSAQHSFILLPDSESKISVLIRRPDPWDVRRVTDQFGGLERKVSAIQKVSKTYYFGQPPWSGMSELDYEKIVETLREDGSVREPFFLWGTKRDEEMRRCLQLYIAAIHTEPSFIDFMRKL